jgi:manganese oxidase
MQLTWHHGRTAALSIASAVAMAACADNTPTEPLTAQTAGTIVRPMTRTYYIAAVEAAWNYAPAGFNEVTGAPFGETENTFVANGPDRIGSTYRKALYREYTDATFLTPKPVAAAWDHLGVLGPIIRGQVGDSLRIVFKNNTSITISMHPHGVFYDKDSEGAPYDDGTTLKSDDAVPPGGSHTYVWNVPPRAGPGPNDASSVLWMYHSHTDEVMDTNAGLIGPIIIGGAGLIRADGTPKDVDREFVTMFTVLDENASHYLESNIQAYTGKPSTVKQDDAFVESNLMHSINGFVYGNLPLSALTMRVGENVRWYLLGMGTEVDLHTPHWHGQTLLHEGRRVDVVELLPATMLTADMVPDNPGTWLFHCHVNDHITAGMAVRFRVLP